MEHVTQPGGGGGEGKGAYDMVHGSATHDMVHGTGAHDMVHGTNNHRQRLETLFANCANTSLSHSKPSTVCFLSHSQGPAVVSIKLRTVAFIPFHLGDQHGQHTRNACWGVYFPIGVGLKRQ